MNRLKLFVPADQYRYFSKHRRSSRLIWTYTVCHSGFDFRLKPLFASTNMSIFKNGTAHFRNSGMKALKNISLWERQILSGGIELPLVGIIYFLLTFTTLPANSADDKLMTLLIFHRKQDLILEFARNVKSCFLGKIRKILPICRLLN